MLLVDWQIKDRIEQGVLKINPFNGNLIQPNSIDVLLGDEFVWYERSDDVIDPYSKESLMRHLNRQKCEYIDIKPQEFYLAETVETFCLPANIVGSIEGKSSLARLGITVHQTGGWIDAGFSGSITLEIGNFNSRPGRYYGGMPIETMVIHETYPSEVPYFMKKSAKYLNQSGPTPSKFYENRKATIK